MGLYLRWKGGELVFYDPDTGAPIATMEMERARTETERRDRYAAEARADAEQQGRLEERQAREAAEARVRELEERLRRSGS